MIIFFIILILINECTSQNDDFDVNRLFRWGRGHDVRFDAKSKRRRFSISLSLSLLHKKKEWICVYI